ncbi:SasC/FmtB family protein [Staphylococcus aureus]|uniref:SasC/FmtB family protein n=1 Tax=Staphylococcus aureus TaxID=1280 RepID=UPI003F5C1EEF
MNLLKKNKYSIRKYKVGIFSTLIGTVLLLSNPNGAQALTTDNNVQSDTNQATPVNSQDKDVANNRGLANSAQNTPNQSATTNQATNQALVNHNNGSIVNQATPTSVQSSTPSAQNNNHTDGNTTATETVSNANNNDVASNNTTLNVPNKTNENGSGGHLTLKEIQEDVRHSSDKPELVAIAEPASNRPKKRSRRAAPADPNATPADPGAAAAGNGGAPVAITAPYTPTTDPNANNAGQNAPNEVLSFDDNSIRPSTNRSVPSVTVVDNLPGFTLINGGKVGVLSHAMVRTSMFEAGSNRTYQAQGNVLALGRISGTDASNHGDFNGIEKSLTVNPNSELIFEFNTMPTKNGQGATNVIIKNADTNDTIAEKTVEGGPTLRLFKVPDNVRNLKIQFVPKNDAITDARGIYQLKDGYKYYSFVDSIGLHSGSHVYVERRTMEPTATNNKEFTVTTSLKNNGNSGASLDTDEFVYKIQLPEGVEYVNNSLTKDFPSNNSGVDVNDMNVTYDAANRVITIKSTGGGTTNSPARLMPDKILDLKYKLRVNNVPTPRTVTFNDTLTYKTYTQDFINSAAESHTVSTNPYTIDIIMNKDALQAEVDRRIQQADYTFASLDIFNDLKKRAQTILAENRNNVPLNKRVSQADIDTLTNQMQHTLIRSVDAENAVNQKADQMEDLVNQNDELTDEEKQAAIQVIEEHKGNIIGDIGDQTTDDGVTRIKDQGIQTLSGDTATPVVKPNAKKAIRDKATKQREIINATPDATEDEIQDAINQLATDETDAIDNVTNATTNADVETAKNNGINTIGSVVPQVTHKQAARDAINQATATKRQQINSNREATQEEKNAALNELTQATNHALEQINQATTEEKQVALNQVDQELATAINNINQADTNAEVDQAQQLGTKAINAIQPNIVKKPAALAQINQHYNAKLAEINATPDATNDEKNAAINTLNQDRQQAIESIKQANTNAEVDQAATVAENNIDAVQVDVVKKQAARDKITAEVAKRIEAVKQTPNATDEEKQAAVNQINQLKDQAFNQINQNQTNDQVDTTTNQALNAIDNVEAEVVIKPKAIADIEKAVKEKQQQIDNSLDSTDNEKEVASQALAKEKEKALAAIDQAQTNSQVNQAATNGVSAIKIIQPETKVKPAAREKINQKANELRAKINQDKEATAEERQVALDKINEFVNQAMTDITNNRTNQQVDDTTSQALDSIALVAPEHIVRAAARDAVKQQYEAKKQEIEQAEHATDEEKQVALNQLANNKKLALQNINQAVTNNDVKRVETNGIATLKGVQPHIVIKPEAQQAIKASAENQVESIKDTPHATVDELDEANQLISDTLKQAQQEIENTNQDAAVTDVRNQTIKAIEQIKPKVRRKRAALDSIEENNKNQLDAIRNTLDTTQDERDVAIDTLNKIVNTIKNDIAQNKTNAEVDRTETDGNDNIKVILPKVQVKPAARQSVGVKAEAQNALIDQSDLSTEEERLAAKHLVEQALNQAIDQINHADKTAQVNQDSIDAQNIISKIKPATTVKATALQQIQNIATNKINLIKANNEATDEEQNIAIAQVEKELIKAKQQIASAVTNADVAYLLHDEKNEIREIEPVISRKASAREQLTTLFNDKKQAIEANIQATVEERNSILAQLQNIYDTAIGQIDQDRSNAQVDKTASLNLQTIHDLDVHPIKKPDAEKTINDDLARVTALVQNYRKVSDRNKADALKAITALKLQMDEELKTARTNADVDAVLKRFNVALSDIEAVITEKENSLLRIDNIAQQTYAKFKAIATPEQLAKVKVLIDQYVADGNRMIDEDATLNDIKQHTQFIVDEILAIKLPAEAMKVSPKVIQPAPKVCTPIKKEETHESRKVEKELPNTGSEEMDLPLKEFALITGAALLARRRTKNEKES